MRRGAKVALAMVGLATLGVLGVDHHSEGQYCSHCGATRGVSQWRFAWIPLWTRESAATENALSRFMQQHSPPHTHGDWRFIDAMDTSPFLGVTGWYAGSHFRRIHRRDLDAARLQEAAEACPELPSLLRRYVLDPADGEYGISDADFSVILELTNFLNGQRDWTPSAAAEVLAARQEIADRAR